MCSVTRLGDFLDFGPFLKPLATINLPKSLALLGNFCKGVKIFNFSSEIIFGQLLQTFGDFFWSDCWCVQSQTGRTGTNTLEKKCILHLVLSL